MPLNLIGKKSWNPYLDKNLSRVKADEEAYTARAEALQKLRDEHEGNVRLARLRGEEAPELPIEIERLESFQEDAINGRVRSEDGAHGQHEDRRKRRKLHGEDDTDRDIRVARHATGDETGRSTKEGARSSNTSLTDGHGHVQLFAPANGGSYHDARRKMRDNDEAGPELQAPRNMRDNDETGRELQAPHNHEGMRFTHAAGYNSHSGDAPWYAGGNHSTNEAESKTNVFGRDDPHKERRAQVRAATTDPLAAMRSAQHRIKQSKPAPDLERRNDDRFDRISPRQSQKRTRERRDDRGRHRHDHDHERRRNRDTRSRSP